MAIRVYLLIDASATRAQGQWDALIQAAKNKPMILAVRNAANDNANPCNQVNVNLFSTNPVRRYVIGDFEIADPNIAALEAVCDSEVTAFNITGVTGYVQKFPAVIQAELRAAATDLGFGALAPLLSVTLIGFHLTDRLQAIAQAQAYLAANSAVWS